MTVRISISGFHRSATSVLANWLSDAGLSMGLNLMPGHISNPKGHFEDIECINMHDLALASAGTSWQFHDEVELIGNTLLTEHLSKYISVRDSRDSQWGVKDPRLCLFLEQWHNAKEENGKFIFVARHWSGCIESLLNRHARELAYSKTGLPNEKDLNFWQNPTLAAQMWISYNERILNFMNNHSSACLLLTQKHLFSGINLPQIVNNKFTTTLNEATQSPFESTLFNDSSNENIQNMLSTSMVYRLNELWSAILELTEYKSANEVPLYYKAAMPSNHIQQIIESISFKSMATEQMLSKHTDTVKVADDHKHSSLVFLNKIENASAPFQVEDILKESTNQPSSNYEDCDVSKIIEYILRKHGDNQAVLKALEIWLVHSKQWQHGLDICLLLNSQMQVQPYIWNHIAICYSNMKSKEEAEPFYLKAIKANPRNGGFYASFARFLQQQGRIEEAILIVENGLEILQNNINLAVLLSELLLHMDEKSAAIIRLSELECEFQDNRISERLIYMTMTIDHKSGNKAYNKHIKNRVENMDKNAFLTRVLPQIDLKVSQDDLISRIELHWLALDQH